MRHIEESKTIANALQQRQAVLFVGAGVSMSVGLPSWESLVDYLSADLGLDKPSADAQKTTYQAIAEYYRLKHGSFEPLVAWMAKEWRVSPDCLRASRLHRLVVELDFPIIYTTNYDSNLEKTYEACGRPFAKITGAADMATARPGVTQIVKYHGDFSNPDTLVLTESDYFDRLAFDAPLDIKFRGDAFASTLLFIGYSMSDLNIRFLLHRLWSIWQRTGEAKQRPPLFLFMHEPDEVQRHVLKRWDVTVLAGEGKDSEDSLGNFLETLLAQARQP
ncbi:Sir2 family NAD-dependent protein deacetylase [Rhizobium leguminosarum]|jgi:hypothetical protein|uniref:SIR2 family NAD-dependent protein deacylase n=1 Tax=Rhizobium leguminosarum TaxID=384 RepID=UPI000FEC39DF|nr:SIR2 family protein [Rhizobium leguminosarum]RWX05148.1 Sir2 family NAD-dependent protein deacetylase [Rhizobium leguminosarum]